MFSRLTSWCFRRRRVVLAIWLFAMVSLNGAGAAVGNDFNNRFSLPGTESQEGFDVLTAHATGGASSGFDADLVFRADEGVDDPAVRKHMEKVFHDVGKEIGRAHV